jgi:hypothetical protein
MIAAKPSSAEYASIHADVNAMVTPTCRKIGRRLVEFAQGGSDREACSEALIERLAALPYPPDAWVNRSATKTGYEISLTRRFYNSQPLRTLAEIAADILAAQNEAEGLLGGLLMTGTRA